MILCRFALLFVLCGLYYAYCSVDAIITLGCEPTCDVAYDLKIEVTELDNLFNESSFQALTADPDVSGLNSYLYSNYFFTSTGNEITKSSDFEVLRTSDNVVHIYMKNMTYMKMNFGEFMYDTNRAKYGSVSVKLKSEINNTEKNSTTEDWKKFESLSLSLGDGIMNMKITTEESSIMKTIMEFALFLVVFLVIISCFVILAIFVHKEYKKNRITFDESERTETIRRNVGSSSNSSHHHRRNGHHHTHKTKSILSMQSGAAPSAHAIPQPEAQAHHQSLVPVPDNTPINQVAAPQNYMYPNAPNQVQPMNMQAQPGLAPPIPGQAYPNSPYINNTNQQMNGGINQASAPVAPFNYSSTNAPVMQQTSAPNSSYEELQAQFNM